MIIAKIRFFAFIKSSPSNIVDFLCLVALIRKGKIGRVVNALTYRCVLQCKKAAVLAKKYAKTTACNGSYNIQFGGVTNRRRYPPPGSLL